MTPSWRWPSAAATGPTGCPGLVDYLYVSTTNSSAFSPTDTMPLSSRVKALMALESTSALVLSLLVVSRAVSILK